MLTFDLFLCPSGPQISGDGDFFFTFPYKEKMSGGKKVLKKKKKKKREEFQT